MGPFCHMGCQGFQHNLHLNSIHEEASCAQGRILTIVQWHFSQIFILWIRKHPSARNSTREEALHVQCRTFTTVHWHCSLGIQFLDLTTSICTETAYLTTVCAVRQLVTKKDTTHFGPRTGSLLDLYNDYNLGLHFATFYF